MARTKEERNAWLRAWRKRTPGLAFKRYHRARMRNKYGMPPERYDYLLLAQHSKCLICKSFMHIPTADSRVRNGKSVVVDHDHETGEVRGLLCNNCNRALGLFSHNVETLELAHRYMKHWESMK